MTVFLYQGEEFLLFLSEYELLSGQKREKEFEEQEEEQEPFFLKVVDYKLFLEKKNGSLITEEAVNYSGGVLILRGLLEEYAEYEDLFSYETVLELIFRDGCLITTVDHSKAGLRIRRNLERGLRSMNSARDRLCIRRFILQTVICDYRQSRLAYGKRKVLRNLHRGIGAMKRKVFKKKKS